MNYTKKMVLISYARYMSLVKTKEGSNSNTDTANATSISPDKEKDVDQNNESNVEDDVSKTLALPSPPSEYFDFLHEVSLEGSKKVKRKKKEAREKEILVEGSPRKWIKRN